MNTLPQVVNLSNAAALIYNALLAYEPHFGQGDRAVNWCGKQKNCYDIDDAKDIQFVAYYRLLHPICSLPSGQDRSQRGHCAFINLSAPPLRTLLRQTGMSIYQRRTRKGQRCLRGCLHGPHHRSRP